MLKTIYRYKYRLLFIYIGLLYFVVFKYLPMIGLIISFQNYKLGAGFFDGPWVGFKHFADFLGNPDFLQKLVNTLIISLYVLIFTFFPPIIVAILLNEVTRAKFKKTVQTLIYLPHFLSWVIIYGIAFAFLSESGGLVNQLIKGLGGDTIGFITSENWFRSVLVGTDMWKETGWGTIIFLAAITGINPHLYEAAVMDGANKWRQIIHVTLPCMMPVITLMLIIRLGHILDVSMEQILVFYNPLVYSVGDIIDTWVYRIGIMEGRFSFASAVGLFKSVVALILVWGANRLSKRFSGSGIW
ncbi:ABC transporter permease [Paenibacillus cymbidii]|uniref:ABC transporter permease n=1 Tax=Paenibacillus cymbidii TaxID=1639034 RepID=UPI0010822E58|nr:ABC transporter permease subunit [Paenibacillus cymbidii]